MTKQNQASSTVKEGVNMPSDQVLDIKLLIEQNTKLIERVEALEKEKQNLNVIEQLASAIKHKEESLPASNIDNINRTNNFKNDALFKMESSNLEKSQQTLSLFRTENKKPISIPKSLQSQFGPSLTVTVNGVRVSIPCDGKTHFINETHWEHAKERIAKVDLLNSKDDDNVIIS